MIFELSARRRFRGSCLGFVLVAFISGVRPAPAQELTLEEAYAAVEAAAAGLESWSADMTMTMNMMGMAMTYEGSMTGKGKMLKGEMLGEVMGMETSVKTTMGADGIQWVETSTMGMNMVMKMDMKLMMEMGQEMMGLGGAMDMSNMGSQNPIEMLRAQGQMFDMAYLGTGTREGVEVMLFGGPVKEEIKNAMAQSPMAGLGMSFGALRMAVGREDGFPREMVMETVAGDPLMTMRYSNVATNIEVADELFAYTPPEGAIVMDYGEMMSGVDMEQIAQMSAEMFSGGEFENAMADMLGSEEMQKMMAEMFGNEEFLKSIAEMTGDEDLLRLAEEGGGEEFAAMMREVLAALSEGMSEEELGEAFAGRALELMGAGEVEAAPEAHTPFDAATMPEAAQVLRGSFGEFARKASWRADAVLGMGDGELWLNFEGAMMGRRSLFRSEFSGSVFGAERRFLMVADAEGQFWFESGAAGETEVEHTDTNAMEREEWAGQPMGVSPNRGPLSGASALLSEMREVYDLANLGVATADGAEVYVIEARLKDEFVGVWVSGMMDKRAEVFTLMIGVEDGLPRRIISRAADGKTVDLKLSDYEFGVELEDALFEYTPPPVVPEFAPFEMEGPFQGPVPFEIDDLIWGHG